MQDVFGLLVDMRDRGEACAMATVIETTGSVSAQTGSRALIDQHGRILVGWTGGGCAESAVCQTALQCFADGQSRIVDLDLDDEVLGTGMPCGGTMRVFIEPVIPKPKLWILGHGRIAEVLCHMGALVGFDIVIDDPVAVADRYPDAARIITDDLDYSKLAPGPRDGVVIATQHKGDHHSIQRALQSDAVHIALIASRKRSRLVQQYLREMGVAPEDLARVRAPAGLDLGARTPEEIALAVLAEIVGLRRQGGLRPRSEFLLPE